MDEYEKNGHQPDLEEESARQRKYWKRNHIWTIAILVIVVIISMLRGGSGPIVTPGETQLTVQEPDGKVVYADYASVTALSLLYGCNYGDCLNGESEGRCYYGEWENEAWGKYELCVYAKVDCCLVIETADGILAVNLSSEAETEQLYGLLLQGCENLA